MSDDIEPETQWTSAAREAYSARAEELLEALRDHITLTLTREGRQVEHAESVPSALRLFQAASAFDEAEFDWSGSSPLGLDVDRLDDVENDEEEDHDPDAQILTVVGRWDYRVIDESALVNAGRAAYARVWPTDTKNDAVVEVAHPAAAAREIAHADGWNALDDVDGLESVAYVTHVILHPDDDQSWLEDDQDPFAIMRQD